MNGPLALVIGVILLTSVCDTVNHLGLKLCANAVQIDVRNLSSLLRYVGRFLRLPLAWVSILFSLISLLLWLYALTMADLSFAFSLDSMHHVFIALVSWKVLKEPVDRKRWLGTLSIVIGVILVASSGVR